MKIQLGNLNNRFLAHSLFIMFFFVAIISEPRIRLQIHRIRIRTFRGIIRIRIKPYSLFTLFFFVAIISEPRIRAQIQRIQIRTFREKILDQGPKTSLHNIFLCNNIRAADQASGLTDSDPNLQRNKSNLD